MNNLFPENSYSGTCSCGARFMAPKGTLHCSNCLYGRITELEKENEELEDCFDECYTELGKVQHELEKETRSKDKRIAELEKELALCKYDDSAESYDAYWEQCE